MRPSLVKPGIVGANHQYLQNLNKVAEAIRSLRPSAKLMETVLYPLSGFDLTAPLVLFPNAKTYILIDRNPVISPGQAMQLQKIISSKLEIYGGDRNKDWVFWRETSNNIFRNLLASIFAISPGSKITRVEFLLDSEDSVSLELRFTDGRNGEEKTVHYWTGQVAELPVEILREQLNEPKRDLWWLKKLEELKPTTLLIKGSHSVLRTTRYPDSPNRQSLIAYILQRGGVVVEGASKQSTEFDLDWAKAPGSGLASDRSAWELTDGDAQFANPSRSIELEGVAFSYTDRVRISVYKPRETLARPRATQGH